MGANSRVFKFTPLCREYSPYIYTYIFREENFFKVGRSTRLTKRIATIRHFYPLGELEIAVEGNYEMEILHIFKDDLIYGNEWFSINRIEDAKKCLLCLFKLSRAIGYCINDHSICDLKREHRDIFTILPRKRRYYKMPKPVQQQVANIMRVGDLLGSKLDVTMRNGSVISGTLIRAPVIDKKFFLYIDQGKNGKDVPSGPIFVSFDEVETFVVKELKKQIIENKTERLACKGKRDVPNCPYPVQNFEPFCQNCPNKSKKVDPLQLSGGAAPEVDENVSESEDN